MIPALVVVLILTGAGAAWLLRKCRHEDAARFAECARLAESERFSRNRATDAQRELEFLTGANEAARATKEQAIRQAEALQLRLEEQKDELEAWQRRADGFRGEYDDALDDARFWQAQADHFRELYEKANADAINAREIVADWVAQRTFGRSIFHKAPPLPEESKHKQPIPKSRIQGRLAVQLADREFAKQEREMLARRREAAAAAEATRQQQAAVNQNQETPIELSQSV